MSQVTASSTWVCAYRQAAWSFFDISMAPLLFSVCISSHSKASSPCPHAGSLRGFKDTGVQFW